MTRKRLASLVVAAAAVVVALVLWLVLGGGEATPPGTDGEGPSRPRPARPAPTEGPALEAGSRLPPATEAPPPISRDGEAAAAAPPPVDDGIPGLAVLEDGTPLAGVQFWFGQGPGGGKTPLHAASGGDGGFALPPDRPAQMSHPWATPVAAAGGTLEGEIVRAAADADRLVITFRDRPGTAHLRLVDASTGSPVTAVAGLRVSWEFRGGMLVVNHEADPGLGGWIAITEGRLPESVGVDPAMLRVDPATVTVVLEMPGFEAARLPLPEVRGRREVRVNPVEPDARGMVVWTLEMPATPSTSSDVQGSLSQVTSSLRSLDPDPQEAPDSVQGMPKGVGSFSLFGLPDGAWEIEVTATVADGKGGSIRRVRKSFERRGATVDIGEIRFTVAGTVRVRVVDAEDRAIPQAWVVAVRSGENPDQARPLYPDGEGRAALSDLEPGVDHRVQVRGLPRLLERSVRAEAGKEAAEVEFRWPEKLVPCRLTLVVDGKVVANPDGSRTIPATIQESPLPRDRGSWGADGTFSADLLPGTYRFSALATAKTGGGLVLFSGEVTVPPGESFAARVEMSVP